VGSLKGRDGFEDLDVDGKIILNRVGGYEWIYLAKDSDDY
jgi:hypothetical protein